MGMSDVVSTGLPDLIPYRKGNQWGFCDKNKKVVIPYEYDGVLPFGPDGLAFVHTEGMVYANIGVIDKTGKEIGTSNIRLSLHLPM